MTKEALPPFTEPLPLQSYDVPLGTVGLELAQSEEYRVKNEFAAANAQDIIAYATELKTAKVSSRDGKLKHLAAKISGNAMTSEEVQLVDRANLNEDRLPRYEREAESGERAKRNMLGMMRHRLSSADRYTSAALDHYLDGVASPFLSGLRSKASQGEGQLSWADWLAHDASDEQLTNFAQWNTVYTADQQKRPDIVALVESERTNYKQVVKEAVEAGWLSKTSLDRLHEVDDAQVMLLDPINGILQGIIGENMSDKITMQVHGLEGEELAARVHDVLPHEFNHKVLQTATDQEPLGKIWIMEALTELSNRMLHHDDKLGSYGSEQLLYLDLMKRGSAVLPIKLGTVAYSGDESEKRQFYEALDSSWGTEDALSKVTHYLYDTQLWLLRQKEEGLLDEVLINSDLSRVALDLTRLNLKDNPELIFARMRK